MSIDQMDIYEVKWIHERAGKFFFTPDTLQFFKDQVENWEVLQGNGGRVFIEHNDNGDKRLHFQVREFYPNTGEIGMSMDRAEIVEAGLDKA